MKTFTRLVDFKPQANADGIITEGQGYEGPMLPVEDIVQKAEDHYEERHGKRISAKINDKREFGKS